MGDGTRIWNGREGRKCLIASQMSVDAPQPPIRRVCKLDVLMAEYGVSALFGAPFRRRALRWRTLLRASGGWLDHIVDLHHARRSGFGTQFLKNRHERLSKLVERGL